MTGACQAILIGHEGEISKVSFNPQGNKIITASSDRTCRVWDVESGDCLQVLEGHTDEIFSAAFNYEGDTIITGSKARTRTRHGLTARLKPFLLPLAGQHVPHLEELNGLGAGEKIK
jgi:dynein assembly factor with WDR repeat domains 1